MLALAFLTIAATAKDEPHPSAAGATLVRLAPPHP